MRCVTYIDPVKFFLGAPGNLFIYLDPPNFSLIRFANPGAKCSFATTYIKNSLGRPGDIAQHLHAILLKITFRLLPKLL